VPSIFFIEPTNGDAALPSEDMATIPTTTSKPKVNLIKAKDIILHSLQDYCFNYYARHAQQEPLTTDPTSGDYYVLIVAKFLILAPFKTSL
jgi:hypothetical protein